MQVELVLFYNKWLRLRKIVKEVMDRKQCIIHWIVCKSVAKRDGVSLDPEHGSILQQPSYLRTNRQKGLLTN
jgi:hypothetical protein